MKKIETLIREEYQKIKLEQEKADDEKTPVDPTDDDIKFSYDRKSKVSSDFNYDQKTLNQIRNHYDVNWNNTKIEEYIFLKLKGLPKASYNAYSFMVPLKKESSVDGGNDWLRFYGTSQNSGVYSYQHQERFDYKLDKGKLYLKFIPDGDSNDPNNWAEIKPTNDKTPYGRYFASIPELKTELDKKIEQEKSDDWLDTLQTIFDWLGFVPFAGDIIDVINAVIYFVRGKTLDGFLSLIAVIPVVGSGLKVIMKTAIKPVEKLFTRAMRTTSRGVLKNAKQAKKAQQMAYIQSWKKGDMGLEDLSDLADGYKSIAGYLDSGKKYVKDMPFLSTKAKREFGTYLNNWQKNMDMFSKAANQAHKQLKGIELAKSLVGKRFKTTGQNISKLSEKIDDPKVLSKMDKVWRSVGLGPHTRWATKMRRNIDEMFVSRLQNSPELAFSVWATGGKARPWKLEQIYEAFKKRTPGDHPNFKFDGIEEGPEMLAHMNKVNPKWTTSVTDNWAREAIQNGHPNYNTFMNSAVANSDAFMRGVDPTKLENWKDALRNYRWNNLKAYDVWSNELGEVFEETGVDYYDDPNSVILSGLGTILYTAVPETYQAAAGVKQSIEQANRNFLTAAGAKARYINSLLGLNLMERQHYATDKWTVSIPELQGQEKADALVAQSENPTETKEILNLMKQDGADMGDFQPYEIEAEVTDEA